MKLRHFKVIQHKFCHFDDTGVFHLFNIMVTNDMIFILFCQIVIDERGIVVRGQFHLLHNDVIAMLPSMVIR